MQVCNCYGSKGQFELQQYFHDMGIEGCARTPTEDDKRVVSTITIRSPKKDSNLWSASSEDQEPLLITAFSERSLYRALGFYFTEMLKENATDE